MKRPQLIGLAVAATAGLLAFYLVRGVVSRPPVEKTVKIEVKQSDVLVARTDIGLGQIANDSLFRWQPWPADTVSPGVITRSAEPDAMTQLSGSIARAPILAGEPITPTKLVRPGQGGVLAAILPAGMRAISTKIREETAVGNLILPNDRVDVILIRRIRGKSGDDYASDLLFGNVRVLAIGQQIETKEGKKTADGAATTATLELTARQAELLALANAMGDISLTLRSIADANADAGPTAGVDPSAHKNSTAVRVLRYGAASRSYGVN